MEKTFPLFYCKCGVKSGYGCKEMILPRLDGSFGYIAAMDVGWVKFEGGVIFSEGLVYVVGKFVVEDVELGRNAIVA